VTSDPTPPRRPRPTGPVQYKGADLDAARGPGLGCFRFQLVVLAVLIVVTPLSVVWDWPSGVSAALLFAIVALLLVSGQTIIFLLRLVAADRRTRRRPLAASSRTVGELEDATAAAQESGGSGAAEGDGTGPGSESEPPGSSPPEDAPPER
jgi:hypothetical protein